MTFIELVWKMAKVNYRKYLFYFLCNSFVVMVFFMFSTVYFNEGIRNANEMDGESLSTILMIPSVALIVFTVFFIHYAHSVFIKRRKKEFGLFLMVGMSDKDISKVLLLENSAIALLSLGVGLLSGSIFSRLFFLLLMHVLEMESIAFELHITMFATTVGVFLIVFSIGVAKSILDIRREEVLTIFKEDRVTEKNKVRSPLLGGVGLLLVIGSINFQYYFFSNSDYDINDGLVLLVGLISLLSGLFFTISHFGSFLIQLARSRKSVYYNRMLFLANVEYKFKQVKGISLLLITMTMVTIFYTSMLLYFYASAEKLAEEQRIYDVSFAQTAMKNAISDDELKQLFNTDNHEIKEHVTLDVLDYFEQSPLGDYFNRYSFLSAEQFNQMYSKHVEVSPGEMIRLDNITPEYHDPYVDHENGEGKYSIALKEIKLTEKQSIIEPVFDQLNIYEVNFIIVHPDDYDRIAQKLEVYKSTIHVLNLSNWEKSGDAYVTWKEQLKKQNGIEGQDPLLSRLDYSTEEVLLEPQAKIEVYNSNRKAGGILFFMSSFLGALFFVSSFMVLYLNIFSSIDQERMTFHKLYKIGMTKKEIRKVLAKELRLLFFLAPLLGLGIAFSYVAIFAKDAGGIVDNPLFTVNFMIVAVFYFVLQIAYYLLAKHRFMKEIMGDQKS
ncbi:ABC transporter permease [Ornithinibacillus sp. BX22]|uniref:ABC transporter permease n=1 Tax=Ornithinibacillus hominis TaxID=2763055 RepID=A0A923RKB7_9BACI|nr:ABC transporter permease [Ornithinibacillus hominis]MBC5638749.1 ABC transporter permease [Ornithinibacillus hominis]